MRSNLSHFHRRLRDNLLQVRHAHLHDLPGPFPQRHDLPDVPARGDGGIPNLESQHGYQEVPAVQESDREDRRLRKGGLYLRGRVVLEVHGAVG